MIKSIAKIMLLLMLSATNINAQLPKASEYFPLKVGNLWEYDHRFQEILQIFNVISDSLFGDSVLVYTVERRSKLGNDDWMTGAPFYYHYNSDSTVIYQYEQYPPPPYIEGIPIINTENGVGHRWSFDWGDCYYTFAVTDTGSATFFNQTLPWLNVDSINQEYQTIVIIQEMWRYVLGIGPIRNDIDTLVYAKINDIEYGTILNVNDSHKNHLITPNEFKLESYPNPFNASTVLNFNLKQDGDTRLDIYNSLGQCIKTLHNGWHRAGSHQIIWDGSDMSGQTVSSGIYFAILQHQGLRQTTRLLLLK